MVAVTNANNLTRYHKCGILGMMKSNPESEMGKILREAFRASGLSVRALSIQSGVYYASVHATMNGTRDPSLSTVSKLSAVLGLELRPVRRGKRKAK